MSQLISAFDTPYKRLRIAVLNRQFNPTGGGAERYSIALVEQLAQRHEIHVFAQHIEHQMAGVSYHRVSQPCSRPRWVNQLWFAFSTWRQTRSGFDMVHSHELTWHGQVQTVHVLPIQYNLFRGRSGLAWALRCLKVLSSPRLLVYLGLERLRYRQRPDTCIVVTAPGLRAVMEQTFPASKRAIEVVTPGVLEVEGAPAAKDRSEARALLGLPEAGHCILFIGNDYRKKGLPALLQALQRLPPDCYLAVVGNAAHIAEFRSSANVLGLQKRVFFLGAQPDVRPAYRAADCLAHPTLEDTFGMVVLEAMSHGLPVVVSSAQYCGIAAFLAHGDSAYVLDDPQDVADLVQGIGAVLPTGQWGDRLRACGQDFARSHLWSAQAREQEAIYLRVAAGPAPSGA